MLNTPATARIHRRFIACSSCRSSLVMGEKEKTTQLYSDFSILCRIIFYWPFPQRWNL